MTPKASRLIGFGVLAGTALLASLACGGGGGGGGPTAPPPPPPSGITFTAAGPAGDNSIALAAGAPGANRLRLEVRANEVVGLYAVALDLGFPTDLLQFDAAATSKGAFLGPGGDTELLVQENPDGNLVIGYSLKGDKEGVDGSGVLFTVEFTGLANGTDSLTLAENQAYDANGLEQADVTWVAGSVQVRL